LLQVRLPWLKCRDGDVDARVVVVAIDAVQSVAVTVVTIEIIVNDCVFVALESFKTTPKRSDVRSRPVRFAPLMMEQL
jgi:hypothetical protein